MPKIVNLKPEAPWQEIQSTEKDWDKAGKKSLLPMLHHLHLIRAFEEQVLECEAEGLIHGPAHSSIGQEGGAVGSIAPMTPADAINGAHRGHHQFLAKALKYIDPMDYDPAKKRVPDQVQEMLQKALAEIMGLAQGFCKGRGGSMHLRWEEAGALGTNAIVGGGVPLANGVAWAKKRRGEGAVVFTYFGDGGVNIGAVPESMNLAALYDLPICFFIENNGYAVSTTIAEETRETRLSSRGAAYAIPSFRVDGMDPLAVRLASEKAIKIMRAGDGPTIIEAVVYRFRHHGGGIAGSAFGYRTKDEEAEWLARDPLARVAEEMIARKWLTQGQDDAMRANAVAAITDAAAELTEKDDNQRVIVQSLWPDTNFRDFGLRGDLSEFDDVRFEELETFSGAIEETKFVTAVSTVMDRRMETDETIFCLGEDIHRLRGGTNGATKGLVEKYPDRIIGTPIAENGFTGLAGGVAMEGTYKPVVELMYADFALVAADQIFNQIAKARHMYGGDIDMPIVIRTKCAIGTGYGSQHSMDPAGLYSNWPGFRIIAPTTPFDYVGLMNSALLARDPVLMIEHVALYETMGPGPADDFDYYIPLGKAKIVRPGNAFTVLTYLAMTPLAQKVADEMGVDAEIVDLRSLDRAGIDWQTIEASIRKTNNVVVLEQGPLTASYGAMLTDEVQNRFFDWLDQPVKRIHGGESSPSVSRILERAAFVGEEEIRAGFAGMMADMGRGLAAE